MRTKLSGKKVLIFGGGGFIGSHLVKHLCKESCQINIISRDTKKDLPLFFANLIGILAESKKNKFGFVHCKIPEMIAKSAQKKNIRNFIHISALNVNKIHSSSYANSKFLGEKKIREIFPNSLIIRPGVVFGKGDNFTNFFSSISNFSPFLPLIGTPEINFSNGILKSFNFTKRVKFQPLYVGDLVKFMIHVYHEKNKIYDLVGPVVKSFAEIFDVILKHQGKKRIYLPLPFFAAKIVAFFLETLPNPLLTRDQINLLHHDSVSAKGLVNLKKVVKNPASMETIVKNYL